MEPTLLSECRAGTEEYKRSKFFLVQNEFYLDKYTVRGRSVSVSQRFSTRPICSCRALSRDYKSVVCCC
ncbi:unnamed protein product [Nippostrongylus brasiliensis]|uniref:Ovule protein n=1 Tax=Nippostrongylus brasiliensis TaxID=27835 RepID=A0A0N4XN94_NIPBR|nr:unnamed protein product [Nippostrongylus brasiliensis]